MKLFKRAVLTICYGLLFSTSVLAQGFSSSSAASTEVAHFKPEQIIKFSKKVERALGASGARVAIIARMGRPASELPDGMHFTHVAFAVYSQITAANGEKLYGYAIQNLYQRDGQPNISDLVVDYPVDFFAGVAQLVVLTL